MRPGLQRDRPLNEHIGPRGRARARGAVALVLLAAGAVAAPARALAQSGRELNLVPIVGGDSDVGLGVGAIGDVASLASGKPPFHWRLEIASFTTFKLQSGRVVLPYQDDYLELLVPHVGPRGRLQVDARLSFTDEATLAYSGIGNASPPPPQDPVTLGEYGRLHPTASVEVRTALGGHFYLLAGTAFTYNVLSVASDSILGQQQRDGPPDVRALLGSFAPHGVELLTAEAQYDSRDDEIVTKRGQFHTLRLRVSPRLGPELPYAYERLTATARLYAEPARWLGLRARLVGDVLLGDAPFYELARFDETPAIGGGKAVRGVPAQRYYGKVKTFGNVEVSAPLWALSWRAKRFVVGPAAFFDAGRSWTELGRAHPELDGAGLGLKYGVGGGLRVQEGRTFMLRLDLAWSPDARPVGAYFAAGDVF